MAQEKGVVGVIALATGATKAPVVTEVVQRGYVNHVIVDSQLAAAIEPLEGGTAPKE